MKLATVKEMADYLKISEAALYRLIKKNAIPFISIGGVYRFNHNDISAWLENGGTNGRDDSQK